MRPTRLELEGFASFRDPVTIDFRDTELFVLSGRTGAGKCLPGDTPVYEGKSGRRMSLEQAVRDRITSVVGYTNGKVVAVPVTDWHQLGTKPTLTITTADGRHLTAATSHPFLTDRGIVRADELTTDDWLAQPAHLSLDPPALLTADEALLIGLLLGDGSLRLDASPRFCNTDDDVLALFATLVTARWPTARVRRHGRSITHGVSNPSGAERRAISSEVVAELEKHGVNLREYLHAGNLAQLRRGERALPLDVLDQATADHGLDVTDFIDRLYPSQAMRRWLHSLHVTQVSVRDKRVPDCIVLQAPEIALSLLSGLIQTDGWCSITKDGRRAEIGFSSSSSGLANDFRTLATVCGMATHLNVKHMGERAYYSVSLDVDAVRSRGHEFHLVGTKADARDAVLELVRGRPRYIGRDRIPPRFNTTLTSHGRYGPARLATAALTREIFLELGGAPDVARAECRWAKVKEIAPGGARQCFDLTVDTPEHLYVADHYIVHNSSVVDAITFALYGTVPRYDDRRMVAPLISQGRSEARVRLDFTVGTQTWTAVRVVRRTKSGATTKEARLERWRDADGTDTVTEAGTADELTARVEALLGLRFEHFTACIVLPQGAFQQFLHSKPRERQDLLVQLLDLDVYRRVGSAARDRATAAHQTVDLLRRRLDGELADATEDEAKQATARIEQLAGLLAGLDRAQPALEEIRQQGTHLREVATTARRRADGLAEVTVPDGVEDLVERLTQAREHVEQADARLAQAGEHVDAATQARQQAGDGAPLTRQLERLAERDRLAERRGTADDAVAQAAAGEADADDAVARAAAALDQARERLQQAQQHDLVATVVADHAPGDPCPVCHHPLDRLPAPADGRALTQAREALAEAEQAHTAATRAKQEAAAQHTRAATERDGVATRLADLQEEVRAAVAAGLPDDPAVLHQRQQDLAALDATLDRARREEQGARTADRTARTALADVQAAEREAWNAFDRTWQGVADLAPPPVQRGDLAAAWDALVDWATTRRPELLAEAEAAEQEVATAADRWKAEVARLREACRSHDVVVRESEQPRDAALREAERARGRHEALVQRVAEAERVRAQLAEAQHQQRLAHELGRHLKSSNFEKWLLNRALKRLVAGATQMLHDLSDGAYSLTLDDGGGFAVVDHRNADETRSARTLSGGETFLASLALALALSEHVADLAAGGAARLESLILDEGFGTLDSETLDVVATALEELGARGRMVGLITHVGALAQRLPVRFEVRKEAGTSSVERLAS